MGAFINLAEGIIKSVSVPVMAVGRINLPEVAESILEEGKADLIGMHGLGKAMRDGHLVRGGGFAGLNDPELNRLKTLADRLLFVTVGAFALSLGYIFLFIGPGVVAK